MTPTEIQALAAPLSDEEPCGPDLEMIGDADYMRFMARIEGVLPKSFAAFDRGSIDFPGEFATLKGLLSRSRDLRLMVFLAKLMVLNRDLAGFAASTQATAALLENQWEPVHPQLLDGDPILRVVCLQMLDDMPDAIMPLQSMPLFETRRFGKASYRSHLLGSGQLQGRVGANENEKDEEVPSADAMKTALAEADIAQLVTSRGLMVDLHGALGAIETALNEKSGQSNALYLSKIKALAQDIVRFLDAAVMARDPALGLTPGTAGASSEAGPEGDAAAPVGVSGPVSSTADALAALAAAARYFQAQEPSSPVLLLIGQVEQLIGKSFYDVLQTLVPDHSASANITIGKDYRFLLPVERLAALTPTLAADEPAYDDGYDSSSDDSGYSSDDAPAEDEETSGGEDGSGEIVMSEEAAPPESEATGPVSAPPHQPKSYRAVNRQNAVALLGQISAYFRVAEPSSPVPLLLDHASALSGRDFFGLLRDLLPTGTLRVDE